MIVKKIGKITSGQDGAIWGNYLFRFDGLGNCNVYKLTDFEKTVASFVLDKAEVIVPHSNSVMFGKFRAEQGDEFPLLYSNIYNNYAKAENPLKGTTAVYRIIRDGNSFSSRLVQLIKIGFAEDELWSTEGDVRPYGNFVIDREKGVYYAFTMQNSPEKTAFFAFDMPLPDEGEHDSLYGVKVKVLGKESIKQSFCSEYCHFIQGATFKEGKIYSLEGFGIVDRENPPAIRIFDTQTGTQIFYDRFDNHGLEIEPEFIDFKDEICYYGDNHGNLYTIEF